MAKSRPSHKALRTCMGCRRVDLKQAMVRVAALAQGVLIDETCRLGGRGGYLHPRPECLQLFVKSRSGGSRSLGRGLDRTERVNLVNMLAQRLATNAEL